jgi:hypothetical protein
MTDNAASDRFRPDPMTPILLRLSTPLPPNHDLVYVVLPLAGHAIAPLAARLEIQA